MSARERENVAEAKLRRPDMEESQSLGGEKSARLPGSWRRKVGRLVGRTALQKARKVSYRIRTLSFLFSSYESSMTVRKRFSSGFVWGVIIEGRPSIAPRSNS